MPVLAIPPSACIPIILQHRVLLLESYSPSVLRLICPQVASGGSVARSRRRVEALVGQPEQPSGPSAVEHRPADLVSQPLILQDEFTNCIRELCALPAALEPAGALFLTWGGSRSHGLDRVSRSAQLMGRDMRHRCGLAGRVRRMPWGAGQVPRRGLRMAGCRAGLRHRGLAAYPSSCQLDGLAGSWVRGLHRLEKVENVLCAHGRPQGQPPMVGVGQRPPAADSDEARVAVFGENHRYTCPMASA